MAADPTQPLEPIPGDFAQRNVPPVPWQPRRPSPTIEAWGFATAGVALLATGLGLKFGVWLSLVVVGLALFAAGMLVEDGRKP